MGVLIAGNSDVLITNSIFKGLISKNGGAIEIMSEYPVLIQNSSFIQNSAESGGAIYIEDCKNVTLLSNIFE